MQRASGGQKPLGNSLRCDVWMFLLMESLYFPNIVSHHLPNNTEWEKVKRNNEPTADNHYQPSAISLHKRW